MSGTPPRLERFGPKTLAGLQRAHNPAQDALYRTLAGQWRDYGTRAAAAIGTSYGVVARMADGDTTFDYFCGAEAPARAHSGLIALHIPALYCAVFRHVGPVSGIREFIHLIFGKVLPLAELAPAPDAPGVPEFIERYGADFDRHTATGAVDILVPIKE